MSSTSMRRRSFSAFGGVTAAGGVCALVAGLALYDERVRLQLSRIVSGRAPSGEIATAGERMQEAVSVLVQAVADQSIEHAPLVVFGVAALVLVLFMTRT